MRAFSPGNSPASGFRPPSALRTGGSAAASPAGGGPNSSRASGSSRRVGFAEVAAAFGSGRRLKDAAAARAAAAAAAAGVPPHLAGLSESQQSATHSAVSMTHIFNEARREIRRGKEQARQGEYAAADGGEKGDVESGGMGSSVPQTPATPHHAHHLSLASDLSALKDMLWESPVLASLLVCIPFGIVAHWTNGLGMGVSTTFLLNFIAIIPLAWLLGNATEELALRSNQTIGGLLNATFGNAVELIVSVIALRKGMIKLVQTSLLGSILSNCLLVLGMSFLLGGLRNKVQYYNHKGAHMMSSLLLLASISLILPAAFVNSFTPHPTLDHLLAISRGTALIMFVIYVLYLYFQLYTHSEMFDEEASDAGSVVNDSLRPPQRWPNVPATGAQIAHDNGTASAAVSQGYQADGFQNESTPASDDEEVQAVGDSMKELADLDEAAEDANSDADRESLLAEELEEEVEEPSLTFACALALLFAVTVLVSLCSEYLVDSIHAVTYQWGMNEAFVGIILIPLVGNAAEHATACTVAMKNKMDLSIGVAIGSSTQIALFLIPFITLVGWLIDQPMSLNFSSFETVSLVVSVLMVISLVKNGESNWLQGVMLVAVYAVIATTFWFHPFVPDDPSAQTHPNKAWEAQEPPYKP